MARKLGNTVQEVMQRVEAEIAAMVKAGEREMHNAAGQLAAHGANHMRQIVQHKGTYKPYQFRGTTRYSSQPGEPPAAITGAGATLIPSIYSETTSIIGANPAVAEFGAKAEFAADLEYGGTSSMGFPMAPRPFLRPAREEVARVASADVRKRLIRTYTRKLSKLGAKITIKLGA